MLDVDVRVVDERSRMPSGEVDPGFADDARAVDEAMQAGRWAGWITGRELEPA